MKIRNLQTEKTRQKRLENDRHRHAHFRKQQSEEQRRKRLETECFRQVELRKKASFHQYLRSKID